MDCELEFSGECPACGTDMEGFFRGVPHADRLVIFACRDCGRATAWIPAPGQAAGQPEPKDVAQPLVSSSPPTKCRICGAGGEDFRPWHSLDLSGGLPTGTGDHRPTFTAPCWECGVPTRISWGVKRQVVSTSFRMSGLLWSMVVLGFILLPALLLLSPLIVAGWAVWIKMRGGCLRCGHPLVSHAALPQVVEDGGGSLHRCPRCHAFYYLPIMGPVDARRLSAEEVRRRWPELGETD